MPDSDVLLKSSCGDDAGMRDALLGADCDDVSKWNSFLGGGDGDVDMLVEAGTLAAMPSKGNCWLSVALA